MVPVVLVVRKPLSTHQSVHRQLGTLPSICPSCQSFATPLASQHDRCGHAGSVTRSSQSQRSQTLWTMHDLRRDASVIHAPTIALPKRLDPSCFRRWLVSVGFVRSSSYVFVVQQTSRLLLCLYHLYGPAQAVLCTKERRVKLPPTLSRSKRKTTSHLTLIISLH